VGPQTPALVIELLALAVLAAVTLVVGYAADRRRSDRLANAFHATVEALPGIGTVYGTFNQMTDLLAEGGTEAFREVKLLEYPTEGSYVTAFVTAESAAPIANVVGDGAVTLFVPMAPNPVMGGFVVHADPQRVHDVDLTVEQGIQSIVTSGVATAEPAE
jgi:uncharacterized membrane protein